MDPSPQVVLLTVNADALVPLISTLSMVTSVLPGFAMVAVASDALPDAKLTLEGSAVIPRGLEFEPSVGSALAVSPAPPGVGVVHPVPVEVTLGEGLWDALLWVCFPPKPSSMGISTASP